MLFTPYSSILLLAASAFAQSTGDLLDAHKAKDWDTQPNGSMNANLNLLNSLFPLLSCGDSTHTISWNPVTKKMGCQALTVGSGDGSIKVTDYGLTCDGSTAIWTGSTAKYQTAGAPT